MDDSLKEEKEIKGEVNNLISEDRVLNFSDAVFAFAATLLVLKIDLPSVAAGQLTSSSKFIELFTPLWPQYLANIISFIVIGYYWINHHAIFSLIKKFDMNLVWINIIFLISVSFLPFPVDLYGSNFGMPLVVVFYSASLAVVGYLLFAVWWYASYKRRLVGQHISDKMIKYYSLRNLVAPVVFTVSIPLVYLHPLIAQICWILIILGDVMINKMMHIKGLSEVEKVSL